MAVSEMSEQASSAAIAWPDAAGVRDLMKWARHHFGVKAAIATIRQQDRIGVLAVDGVSGSEGETVPGACAELFLRAKPFCQGDAFAAGGPSVELRGDLPFCAGEPIVSRDGELEGGVYVFDSSPRHFDVIDREVLRRLAELVRRSMDAT